MKTLRQLKARAFARARRRLSRFTNSSHVRDAVEVIGPRTALSSVAVPASVQAPREAVFVAAPPGVSDLTLAVPLALTSSFCLPESEPFRRVEQATKVLAARTVSSRRSPP